VLWAAGRRQLLNWLLAVAHAWDVCSQLVVSWSFKLAGVQWNEQQRIRSSGHITLASV